MIEHSSFLGLPLRTAGQRRLVVVLYYILLGAFGVVGFTRGKGLAAPLIGQTVLLGGLLGGLRAGGPVKPYSEPKSPLSGGMLDEALITLDLNGRSPRAWGPFPWMPLDEREREQRDRAHYMAYRMLRLVLVAFFCPFCMALVHPIAWLVRDSSLLVWLLVIVALSLPQSVLLWTEPDEPAGELTALSPVRR